MQENSFLPSEEPKEQHQGEGAQGNIVTKSFFFNFSAILCPIIVKFGGHLPFSNIYKFCKRDFSLQPPEDPREQHPGDARQRTSSSKIFFSF